MPHSLSFTQRFRTLKIQILLLHLRAYIDYRIYFVMIQAYVIPANAFRIVAKCIILRYILEKSPSNSVQSRPLAYPTPKR